jgi:hypothetical protein
MAKRRQIDEGAPASVVDDVLDNPADVAIALCEVEYAKARRRLVVVRVRRELQAGVSVY